MLTQTLKKYFVYFLLLATFALPLQSFASYNSATAQVYLQNHADSPWTIMALSALGQTTANADFLKNISSANAIDYEAPILAITSQGNDAKTFASTDYVAKLKSFASQNQIGDVSALNDDFFGVLALISAGVPSSDPVVANSESFILSHQNQNGGWGWATSAGSDSNDTAIAIVALTAAGLSNSDTHIQNALNYLHIAQNSDGGFTYDPQSSFGTTSDTSSTAWVMFALNALHIDQTTWSKNGKTPKDYIEGNQTAGGYFASDSSSSAESASFSKIVTAYAVIALTGKTLPLQQTAGAAPAAPVFPFRIEGSSDTVCEGSTQGPSALDVVKNASILCGFTYHIKDTSFGPYLDQINADTAAGSSGWLYFVGGQSPSIGANDYKLKTGDDVLWAFGDFNIQPTRLSLSAATLSSGQSTKATVEYFATASNTWTPLVGATVNFGASTATTAQDGTVSLSPADGFYKTLATKTGFVRSNSLLLKVGSPSSSQVNLTVNIPAGTVQGTSTQGSLISFTVDQSALDFGDLAPGSSASRNLNLKNTGSTSLQIASVVSGDSVFTDNLKLNAKYWRNFSASLANGQSQPVSAQLTIPQNYNGLSGSKSGQIIFWAQ